ncbi:hypothetical protein PVAND_009598 [Polypedilum vanderplanki]|uniref:Uncharacterized protein n=1 Tax=Polypedilum vanderplanki TaxID=319348 RepID=A0A9J6CEL9_POLVA|nr:hypothetical protein PVAND_009598 [Polypedilum vanderplanki]
MYSSHFHGNLLAPAFPAFNQYPPPTPIYPSPPQIFYWTGYPNGPMSPTAAAYIQPLPLPPHAFHHFPPDRPTLVPIDSYY